MDTKLNLEEKPLARALVLSAVRSADLLAVPEGLNAPTTHQDLLKLGITRTALYIADTATLLLGRRAISSCDVLPEDAPVIVGFSLFVMLGIVQAVNREGIPLDVEELTESLIERQLSQHLRSAGNEQAAGNEALELSRVATQIPGQIVETAKGEVEELFSRCYSVLPAFVQGDDKTRVQLMPIFGTALHVLLQSQVKPDR